jgi:hypothetical protein
MTRRLTLQRNLARVSVLDLRFEILHLDTIGEADGPHLHHRIR